MLGDIWTVILKEWKEIFLQRGSLAAGVIEMLMLLGLFGVLLPLQMGRAFVQSPIMVAFCFWMPTFLVSWMVADSFAGERERHTLEALLATRLSDRAILFGKLGAVVGYGWGMIVACLLLGLVTVNLAHSHGEFLFYPPVIGGGALALSLLNAGLVAGTGVSISLRAATVRQAQLTLGLAIMMVCFAPIFVILALPRASRRRVTEILKAAAADDVESVVLVTVAVLIVLNVVVILTAMTRFKRARLILK